MKNLITGLFLAILFARTYVSVAQIRCCTVVPPDVEKTLTTHLQPLHKFGDGKSIVAYFPTNSTMINDSTNVMQFNTFLKTILKKDRELKATKGSVGFGLSLDEAQGQKQTKLYSKVALSKGTYPSELVLNSEVEITAQNGVLQENLSRLFMSYDHYLNSNVEFFTFLSRYNDKFLNIDSRYEAGFGFVFDIQRMIDNDMLKTKLDVKMTRKFNKKTEYREDIDKLDLPDFEARDFYTSLYEKGLKPAQKTDFIEQLKCIQNTTINGFYKQVLPVRFAVLLGVFYELEKVSLSEELMDIRVITTSMGTTVNVPITDKVERSLDAADQFRFEVRPTLDINLGSQAFVLRIRPYFKLPFSFKATDKVFESPIKDSNGNPVEIVTVKNYDWRFDGRIEMKAKINFFSATLSYDLLYDEFPQRAFLESSKLNKAALIVANSLHHIVRFTFNYEF